MAKYLRHALRKEKFNTMETICENLQMIGSRIREAEQRYGRETNSVSLLAVSKFHPVDVIQVASKCGQLNFGENYVQEMQGKIAELQTQPKRFEWHFIGPIQSNKTKSIAAMSDWVHSVDRLKIARRLSDQKPENKADISICLQLNISGEATKSGLKASELDAVAEQVQNLEGVRLRGLMAIPAPEADFDQQRRVFAKVRHLFETLNAQGHNLDTLSMGMTGDMEAAIAEGATIVRIGTAIFGARQ